MKLTKKHNNYENTNNCIRKFRSQPNVLENNRIGAYNKDRDSGEHRDVCKYFIYYCYIEKKDIWMPDFDVNYFFLLGKNKGFIQSWAISRCSKNGANHLTANRLTESFHIRLEKCKNMSVWKSICVLFALGPKTKKYILTQISTSLPLPDVSKTKKYI